LETEDGADGTSRKRDKERFGVLGWEKQERSILKRKRRDLRDGEKDLCSLRSLKKMGSLGGGGGIRRGKGKNMVRGKEGA